MAGNDGWYIVAPFGASTGSGLSGTIPKGSMAYHATGKIADILFGDEASNNATPVIISGRKWEVVFGPYPTKQEAESKSPASPLQVLVGIAAAGTSTATGHSASQAAAAGTAAQNDTSNALAGLQQIGNFFNDLTQRNTWLRVAKIAAGFVLVVVGVLHLVHAGNIVAAAARKVPV